jgi:outer membrane protein assembly factor BamD (BamD/ComL family)
MTTENQNNREIDARQSQQHRFVDLWSRPGPWARRRAYLFLFINMAVYASLTVFIFWMHQATLFDFSWQSYAVTYQRSLVDFLFFPISIREAPVMISIVGMLMANIIIVPILISQLYGFRYSLFFSACVCVFAHLPMLSLFLVASSFIASASKHKLPFKFGVAILGLLPLALYFYLATQGAHMLRFRSVDPTLLYAPWLFAFLAAAGIAGAVLAFARFVHYRPGGVLIGMIPFFLIPVFLFQQYIGVDQLEFRLLVHRYGPDSSVYTPVEISAQVFQETLKVWRRYKLRDLQAIVDLATIEFPFVANTHLQKNRCEILSVFGEFQARYHNSRFMPNAMYMYGLAKDLHFDYGVLQKNWTVEYITDWVSPLSRSTWQTLVETYPDSIYAEPARLRLAILAIRDERIDEARELLDRFLVEAERFRGNFTSRPVEAVPSIFSLFHEPEQNDIPSVNLPELMEQAQELRELIEQNGSDPQFGATPLAELMKLDPHHLKYRDHLLVMAIKFTGGKLHDNLLVRYAVTDPDPNQRRVLLERYAEYFKGQDAGAEALYKLANLLQGWGLANMDNQAYQQARDYYRRVMEKYPDSIYSVRARTRLNQLEAVSGQLAR